MAPAIVFGLVVILAIGSECQAQAQPMEAGDRGFSVQGPPSPYSCEGTGADSIFSVHLNLRFQRSQSTSTTHAKRRQIATAT